MIENGEDVVDTDGCVFVDCEGAESALVLSSHLGACGESIASLFSPFQQLEVKAIRRKGETISKLSVCERRLMCYL